MKRFFYALVTALLLLAVLSPLPGQDGRKKPQEGKEGRRKGKKKIVLPADVAALRELSVILGRPTDKSVTANILSRDALKAYIEYGTVSGEYPDKTDETDIAAATALEITLAKLKPDTRYYYRLRYRKRRRSHWILAFQ